MMDKSESTTVRGTKMDMWRTGKYNSAFIYLYDLVFHIERLIKHTYTHMQTGGGNRLEKQKTGMSKYCQPNYEVKFPKSMVGR